MKILYHHRIGSKDGQYVHVEELSNALRARGHELVFVSPTVIEKQDFGQQSGFVARLKAKLPGWIYEPLEFTYNFLDYIRLSSVIKRVRPDIIYERYNLNFVSGIWAKNRYQIPLLLEVNAPLYAERKKYDGIALDWLAGRSERYCWQGADRVLPVTHVLASLIAAEDVPAEHIQVIPNGADLSEFTTIRSSSSAKEELGLPSLSVLGFVGFVRSWHGIDRVIECLPQEFASDWQLVVVGDGPARADLERLAHKLDVADRVVFTGLVGRDAVKPFVEAFDIALQPWVVDYASPLKLFEYMALARAIIAPDTLNIREVLVDGENAVLFNPDDRPSLQRALKKLTADAILRERIGNAARVTVETRGLTWADNAKRVERIARNLVSAD